MAGKVIMPKLGMSMTEGSVGKWVKKDGDAVTEEDIIAVILTKKITYELKAGAAGTLRHVVRLQETRPVGAVIGWILAPGEAMPETGEEPAAPALAAIAPAPAGPTAAAEPAPGDAPQPGGFVVATPSARRLAREAGVDLSFIHGSGPNGRVGEEDVKGYLRACEELLVTPAARSLAEARGVDLLKVRGSGEGGRILEEDVERSLREAAVPVAAPPPSAVPPSSTAPSTGGGRCVAFSGVRQVIAENMLLSLQTTAQVTITTEVDVTEMVALRERLKKDFDLTYTDLILKGVALALRKHPRLNATLQADSIRLLDEINLGVGVALEEGLIVPVIRGTDRLSLQQIGAAVRDLAARARSDTLSVDEISGGTFTITNLGAYGIDAFTPVINPPEAAILGVGRILEKPAVYRGEITRRSMMVLSLTFDHRVIDGAPAAAFLQTLADMLAHPYLLGTEAG